MTPRVGDLEVIRRVGAGDHVAFRALVGRYQGPLYVCQRGR